MQIPFSDEIVSGLASCEHQATELWQRQHAEPWSMRRFFINWQCCPALRPLAITAHQDVTLLTDKTCSSAYILCRPMSGRPFFAREGWERRARHTYPSEWAVSSPSRPAIPISPGPRALLDERPSWQRKRLAPSQERCCWYSSRCVLRRLRW